MDQLWTKSLIFEDVESLGILAGVEENGNKVYVGRGVTKDGNMIPAKVVPALKSSFYAFNDIEEATDQLEFLNNSGEYSWTKAEGDITPDAALLDGFCIGRALYKGHVVVGRVDSNTKELKGSYDGHTFNLSSYDVLVHKSEVKESSSTHKSTSVKSSSTSTKHESSSSSIKHDYSHSKTALNGFSSGQTVPSVTSCFVREEETFTKSEYNQLINKIQRLEMEKISLIKDNESFKQRYLEEQRMVVNLNVQINKLRTESSHFSVKNTYYEEKFTSEHRKCSEMVEKYNEINLKNSFIMKRVVSLEEALSSEKSLRDSICERHDRVQTYYKSLLTKVTSFEENIKIQQQKIFDLESEIMISSSNSESFLRKIADYESDIKYWKLQWETVLKKLELSGNDNEYLSQKLSMLTKTLRTYQGQIECLISKVQSSKTVIAQAHSDLSRANAQVSKYQAALSSCYILNGDLMTKVSGMKALAQHQVSSDCSFNLINYSSDFGSKFSSYGKASQMFETIDDSFLDQAFLSETRVQTENITNGVKITTSATSD